MNNGFNLKTAQKLSAAAFAAIVLLPVAGSFGDDRNKTETIVPVREAPVNTASNLGPNEWQVETASGSVGVTDDETPGAKELREGMVIAPGAQVETGPNGWVVLTNARDVMAVAAKTKFSLPKEARDPKNTQILQNIGSILFKVNKEPRVGDDAV